MAAVNAAPDPVADYLAEVRQRADYSARYETWENDDVPRLLKAVEAALAEHEMEVQWPLAVLARDTDKDDPKVWCGHSWADIRRDADAGCGLGGHDVADDGTDSILCMDRDEAEEVCGGACSEDHGAGPVPWPCPTYAAITRALLGEDGT